jgi:hypothetical protein
MIGSGEAETAAALFAMFDFFMQTASLDCFDSLYPMKEGAAILAAAPLQGPKGQRPFGIPLEARFNQRFSNI